MITNYFEDLWKKAKKKGITRYQIGRELFGQKRYHLIYVQGRVSKYMQKRHAEIEKAINKLAKRTKKVKKK